MFEPIEQVTKNCFNILRLRKQEAKRYSRSKSMAERKCLGIFWLMGILTDVNQENSHTDDGYMSTLLLYNLQAITKFLQDGCRQKLPFC